MDLDLNLLSGNHFLYAFNVPNRYIKIGMILNEGVFLVEFVILGFLMIRSLTQYDLRRALQQKVSPFFSASLGSIQAALKKLVNNGHIELHEAMEKGRRKKIYSINRSGRQYFMNWMLSSIAPNRLEQDASTRLFFLGLMSPPERLAIISEVIARLAAMVEEYESSRMGFEHKAVPEHLEQIAKYQLKTLDMGLHYHRSMLEWFRKLYAEEVK